MRVRSITQALILSATAAAAVYWGSTSATAQNGTFHDNRQPEQRTIGLPGEGPAPVVPILTIREAPRQATLHLNGVRNEYEAETVWRPICGSDLRHFDLADLTASVAGHMAALRDPSRGTVVNQTRGVAGGMDIVFNLSLPPAAALPAFAAAEAYLENIFNADPITVSINVSFQALGPGVLGSTASSYVVAPYETVRNALQANMDFDDVIQSFLPAGTTVPVRYNGNRNTVTNENRCFVTLANFNAVVGVMAGVAANMTFSTNFAFDFDPADGTVGQSFQDVIIHEVGHSLGFTSGVGSRFRDINLMDLYRFAGPDGANNYNPDDANQFQTTPRLADSNVPNDGHNSDIISAEFRMSDGNPYQTSHFREQSNPNIGLMDPALAPGESHFANFFSLADLTMFDALGYHLTTAAP